MGKSLAKQFKKDGDDLVEKLKELGFSKKIEFPNPDFGVGFRIPGEALDGIDGIAENIEQKIESIFVEASKALIEPLTEALNKSLEASWGWDGGARDIIDTGELRDSLEITVDTNGKVNVNYSSPYAALIHYGGYIMPYGNNRIEKVFIPGRPWIQAVFTGGGPVEPFDFTGHYKKYFDS